MSLHKIGFPSCTVTRTNAIPECWLVHYSARRFVIRIAVHVQYQEHCGNTWLFCTIMNCLIPLYVCVMLIWNLRSEGFPLMSLSNITYKCTKHCHLLKLCGRAVSLWYWYGKNWETNSNVTAFDLCLKGALFDSCLGCWQSWDISKFLQTNAGIVFQKRPCPSLHIISISLFFHSTLYVFSYLHNY